MIIRILKSSWKIIAIIGGALVAVKYADEIKEKLSTVPVLGGFLNDAKKGGKS